MSNSNNPQPWLDDKGKPLSEAKLREASQRWDEGTWLAYLDSLNHTRDEHLADDFEDLLKQHDREEALRKYFETEFCDSCPCVGQSEAKSNLVAKAMSDLPFLEREILFLHFWEGKTQEEIAELLEHSRGTIRRRYLSAMDKMKAGLRGRIGDQGKNPESA